MDMLAQMMGMAGQAQQMDESAAINPLKAQFLRQQIQEQQFQNEHAQEQMQSQQRYHDMMSLPNAVAGIQGAGYGPEEMKLMLQKMFGLGDYNVHQAGQDYIKRMLPKEYETIQQLGGHQ